METNKTTPEELSAAAEKAFAFEDATLNPFLRKLVVFCAGGPFLDAYILVIIGAALVQLGPELNLTAYWSGMIGAASLAGIFVGGCFFGYVTDVIGRKLMFRYDLIFFVVLSTLHLFADTPMQLVILRFLLGIAIGADYPISTSMLAEFSPKKYRGTMLGILMVMWYVGSVCANFVGYLLIDIPGAWRWMLASAAVPAVILIIGRWGTPESPRWLLSKNRLDEALVVVKKAYGPHAVLGDLEQETEQIKDTRAKLTDPGYLKRLTFVGGFWVCQVIPLFGIFTFGPKILTMFGLGHGSEAMLGEALISVLFLIGIFPSLRWIETLGRRPLIIRSFVVMSLGMVVLALSSSASLWIIALGFALYAIASGGPNIMEWVAPNELFPTEIRATAVGLATGISRLGAAVGTFYLPHWLDTLGLSNTMWILTGVTLLGLFICIALAPETKGMTLAEASSLSQQPSGSTAKQ